MRSLNCNDRSWNVGQLLEHAVEVAGALADLDHPHAQFVKHVRLLAHRLGHPGAGGHAIPQQQERRSASARMLPGEDLDGVGQVDADRQAAWRAPGAPRPPGPSWPACAAAMPRPPRRTRPRSSSCSITKAARVAARGPDEANRRKSLPGLRRVAFQCCIAEYRHSLLPAWSHTRRAVVVRLTRGAASPGSVLSRSPSPAVPPRSSIPPPRPSAGRRHQAAASPPGTAAARIWEALARDWINWRIASVTLNISNIPTRPR